MANEDTDDIPDDARVPSRPDVLPDVSELLEKRALETPGKTFLFEGTSTLTYFDLYAETYMFASAIKDNGLGEGDRVALDLPAGERLVVAVLAGALTGVVSIPLSSRLTAEEKASYLAEAGIVLTIDVATFDRLLAQGDPSSIEDPPHAPSPTSPLVGMFTSGTTGKPKLALLSQSALLSSAAAVAEVMSFGPDDLWQDPLPLFHVGGLSVVFRTLLMGAQMAVYPRFDPETLLDDEPGGRRPTHVSVVDSMLCDLMDRSMDALRGYRVIHLGGSLPREGTLARAAELPVWCSYGMTEVASTFAACPIAEYADRGLAPLPGCRFRISDPDDEGRGRLAVKGPILFSGYDGLGSPCDGEGFFETGDSARPTSEGKRLIVLERTGDLFISGGENVYPSEIEAVLSRVAGVDEMTVVGIEDERWGRVPIAFFSGKGVDLSQLLAASASLARFKRPKDYVQMGAIMRTALGKKRRTALEVMFRQRIDVVSVHLRLIDQPLLHPFTTANGTLLTRRSLIVVVEDAAGRRGVGECTSFDTDWYQKETISRDLAALEDELIPVVLERSFLTAYDVYEGFAGLAAELPQARSALETACWDLYGRVVGRPIRELIGGVDEAVPLGRVLGIMPLEETLAAADRAVAEGYRRIKLKIRPGDAEERVRALRGRYPELLLMVDANRSWRLAQADELRRLDGYGLVCIEEPFADTTFDTLAEVQRTFSTPLCLDESYTCADDLGRAMAHPELRCVNLKIGKLGGLTPTMNVYSHLREMGCTVWMGGMYETGISKRLHACFESIPGIDIPGDISPAGDCFAHDLAVPPLTCEDGLAHLGSAPGLGIELDEGYLDSVTVDSRTFGKAD